MTISVPPETDREEREPPRDEEGLLLHYDVVLCGTGLVQSLLASALARAGKSVLHCDGNDYYGEYDAVLPFTFDWKQSSEKQQKADKDEFCLRPNTGVRLHSSETLTHMPIQRSTIVSTPYGDGEVISIPKNKNNSNTVSIKLKNWTLANGVSPMLHVGIPRDGSWEEHLLALNIIPSRLRKAQQVLQQKRSFAFDMTPSLLFASGPGVNALLTSGVADYMEFKALEGLLWFGHDGLSRVPCSKGDVFGTSLLSPLEKRRLMKFLQLTLDYATAQQQREHAADTVNEGIEDNETPSLTEVQSLNEHHLNQGRSLARPQNKAIATSDLQVLNGSLDKMPFDEYLSANAKLTPNLIKIVQHALALEPTSSNLSTRQGMAQLCQHVQSLGRFGTTAFIVPIYGSGELSQSFCRSAAVHGATYLLRRSPIRVIVRDGKANGIQLSNPEDASDGKGDKIIPCDNIILDSHAIAPVSSKRLYRRLSIVLGKVLDDQQEQRHVLIVPPGTMNNTCAIHGLVLDDAVGVAPSGCTILHLTTTGNVDEDAESVLAEFVTELKADEIHHISFSYPLPDEKYSMDNAEGLYCIQSFGQSLTLDNKVEEAKNIFQAICPDVDFLKMSQKMDEIVKERLAGREEEDDEERMVLESAMKMMDVTDDSS